MRVRTSSVFRAASTTESGRARIAASRKPLRSVESSASSTSSEAGGSDPSSFIRWTADSRPGVQGVDLGVRAGARLRKLERELFAADAQAAGGAVDAEQHEALGEAVDASGAAR